MEKEKLAVTSTGSRILANLREAVDWVEGQVVEVRLTTLDVREIARPSIDKIPSASRPMSAVEIERAALSDPDALPLTSADLARMPRTPQVKRRGIAFRWGRCGIGSRAGRSRTSRRGLT